MKLLEIVGMLYSISYLIILVLSVCSNCGNSVVPVVKLLDKGIAPTMNPDLRVFTIELLLPISYFFASFPFAMNFTWDWLFFFLAIIHFSFNIANHPPCNYFYPAGGVPCFLAPTRMIFILAIYWFYEKFIMYFFCYCILIEHFLIRNI